MIFASRFNDSADPTTAFGMNLLGAMIGGCLEYLALVTGYQALLVIAALLYVGALILGTRRPTEPRTPSRIPVESLSA